MGVDISISYQSMAQCAEAKCKSFRPSATNIAIPLKQTLKSKTASQRWFIPADSIPISIDIPDGKILEQQVPTALHFAVEVTISEQKRKNQAIFHFQRWVGHEEYSQVKEAYTNNLPLRVRDSGTWHNVDYDQQRLICNSCPLRTDEYQNCEPSLFSYSDLHQIRAAATLIFTAPPIFVYEQVVALIEDFFQILPDDFYTDKRNNVAASDTNFREILAELIGTQQANSRLPSPETEKYDWIAEKIINRLFFRDNDKDETFWLDGERLIAVVGWLNQLLDVTKAIFESELIEDTKSLEYFLGKLKRFTQAHEKALKYNLKIGTSW